MKRIVTFGRVIIVLAVFVVVVGIIAWLGNTALGGAREIAHNVQQDSVYSNEQVVFPAVATTISALNIKLDYDKTHAPSPTATPIPPTDLPIPTDIPDSPFPTETSLATAAVMGTDTPTPTNTDADTATNPPTLIPTDTPTQLVQVQQAPPTNTKRPTFVQVTDTYTPTATPIPSLTPTPIPPTAVPTFTLSPTLTPTPTTVVAQAITLTPGATSTLPVVHLPAVRTETRPQETAIPTAAPRVKANGNDIMNIALLGTDQDDDPSDPSFRTDTILIVSINRTTNTVAMLSIPRDLLVYIPTLGMERVNVAFDRGDVVKWTPGGGFGLFQATMLYNFGIPVHYYAKLSFNAFKQVIDAVNGVDLGVDCTISDLRFQGQYDALKTPIYSPYTLKPGYYHMDGSFALWYARMRHSTSDFDRGRRQQQIVRAIWQTAKSEGLISKAPELWSQLTQIVDTNLQLPDVLGLVPMALNMKITDVRSYYMIKGYQTIPWTIPSQQANVQLPSPDGFFSTINDFYTPPTANRLAQESINVEIVNGSSVPDMDKVAAERLTWEGFTSTAKGTGDHAAKTVIYDFTGGAKPATLAVMTKALNYKAQVVEQPDPNRTTDIRVVLGDDYNSCSAPGFGS